MSADNKYRYEIKCIRCGTLSNWVHADVNDTTVKDFEQNMTFYIEHPNQRWPCENCKKDTVGLLVSYQYAEGVLPEYSFDDSVLMDK